MASSRDRIEANLDSIRRRVAAACDRAGRKADDVRLVAVTKSVGVEEAEILLDLGLSDLGENRLESAREKIAALGDTACWHMIGNIQRRKVRDVVDLFDRIDAMDRLKLAQAIEKRCEEQGKTLPILIEVNIAGEEAKHGFDAGALREELEQIAAMPHLQVRGLMTMAPFAEDPEETRPVFARLRNLAMDLGLHEVSMGMTNDFEVAIEEGATEIRIGTALFK